MNARNGDEDKTDLEKGSEAGSDEETGEDGETDGSAIVPPGRHGMFYCLHINFTAVTYNVTQ